MAMRKEDLHGKSKSTCLGGRLGKKYYCPNNIKSPLKNQLASP